MIKNIIIVFTLVIMSLIVTNLSGCDSDCDEVTTTAQAVDGVTLPGDVTPTLAGDATPTEN